METIKAEIDRLSEFLLANFKPVPCNCAAEMLDRLKLERETISDFKKQVRKIIALAEQSDLDDEDELENYIQSKCSELLVACHKKNKR